jgi:rubrerythrin
MSTHGDGGKGSGRRKEDASKVRDNWDLIWGNKKDKEKSKMDTWNQFDEEPQEIDHSEEEWTCDVCGGPMYSAPHWNYGQCDDCGARQELINDDYL